MITKSKKSKLIDIKLKNQISCKCSLGEGLLVSNSFNSWVDINNDNLFIYKDSKAKKINLNSKPSVCLDVKKNIITLGCDKGLSQYDLDTCLETVISNKFDHDISLYRSNDGCSMNDDFILGFMHRERPEKYKGYIYYISNSCWHLIDSTISIPNGFIEIDQRKILISDSLSGEIWLFEFEINGTLKSKKLWAKIEGSIAPDGGCIVEEMILISLWDNSSIGVFKKNGELIEILDIPVLRPTNCKFLKNKSELWVTSAMEGLSKSHKRAYPSSGDTLVFDINIK